MQQRLCHFFDRHTVLNCIFCFLGVPLFLVGSVASVTFCIAALAESVKGLWMILF